MRLPHFRTSALPHFRTSALLSIALLFSQLAHAQADATSGHSGISIAPSTTNASRNAYTKTCNGTGPNCSMCISESGNYNISAITHFQYYESSGLRNVWLLIDGWITDSNLINKTTSGHMVLSSTFVLSAPKCFTATLSTFGAQLVNGERFQIIATPTN